MATTTLPPDSSDIKKMGFLVKLKTNKKKLFVLRDKSGLGPARLEYYDSEKKLRSGQLKRTIVLSTCFNINKKAQPGADGSGRSASGGAGRHAIVLFTKDDCFTVGCESEAEQTEWLTCLTELRNANLDESTLRAPLFEHIWSVSVKAKELGSDKKLIIPGQYRLCLTNNNLSLIRINEDLGTIVPIDYIKRVGHSQHFVFLELGRSAVTGPGNLWLQVEDAVIAQNIHSAVLSCMNLIQQQPQTSIFRGRSHTSAVTGKEREKQRRSRGLADSGTGITTGRPRRALTIHGGQSSLSALAQARQNIESKQQTSQRRSTERRSMLDATFDQRDLRPTSPSGSVHLLSPEVPLEEEESDYLQHDPAVEDNTNPNAYMLRSSPTCIYNRLGSKLDATDGSGRISSNDPKLMGDTILTSHTASYTQSSTTAVTSSNSGTYLNMDSLRSAGVELPGVSQDKNRTSCVVGDSYMEMSHRNVTTSTGRTTTSSVTSGGTGSLRSSVQGLTGSSISQTVVIGQHSGPSQIGSHDLLDNKQSVVSGITSDKDSYMMMSAPTETRCIVTCGDKEPPPGSGDSQEPRGCEIVGTEQKEVDEYVSMSAPSNEGYLPMSIKRANDDVSHDSNSSVSSVISSADSSVNEQGSEVPFRSLSRLPEISGDAGYIEMSSPLQEICPRPRLDTVHSYLREDDSHMLAEFPIRAYSVGSKPTNQNYVDMTGGKGKVRERSLMIGPDRSNTEKSSSAPHLNDGSSPHSSLSSPQQNSPGGDSDDHVMKRPPIRPISIVQPPADTIDDRFMELDFNRRESSHDETLEPPRNRSSSGGSKDLRMKAFSFSGARDAFARLSLFRKGSGSSSGSSQASQKNSTLLNPSTAQPRTTSRNRTESFGLSNPPRPRAATEGHRSMLGGALDEWVSRRGSGTKMREDADGVGRSFNEHVPATNLGYMDMTVSSTSAQSSDGYMEMKAQPSSVYMDMKVGESVTTSCSEKGSASSSIALCKTEAKTLDARVDQQETSDYMECNPSDCDSNAHCKTAGKTSQVMTTKAKESAYMDMQPSAAIRRIGVWHNKKGPGSCQSTNCDVGINKE